jgi:hypothetical protein
MKHLQKTLLNSFLVVLMLFLSACQTIDYERSNTSPGQKLNAAEAECEKSYNNSAKELEPLKGLVPLKLSEVISITPEMRGISKYANKKHQGALNKLIDIRKDCRLIYSAGSMLPNYLVKYFDTDIELLEKLANRKINFGDYNESIDAQRLTAKRSYETMLKNHNNSSNATSYSSQLNSQALGNVINSLHQLSIRQQEEQDRLNRQYRESLQPQIQMRCQRGGSRDYIDCRSY